MDSRKPLTVSSVARASAVNLQTIRYYERRGLLPRPPRSGSNYRLYTPEAVARVRFIKRAQELGFSLREIKELLSLRATPGARCEDVRRRAAVKVKDIDDKIRTLKAMRQALTKLVAECRGTAPLTACPILEAFSLEVKS
ncbi:MAG: heavy metal-responsive transcriptional regulator [Planctomycetes bacterium]|nr:heavy metal-responsive transcriptional regulator [Planctomycetota bacterium]